MLQTFLVYKISISKNKLTLYPAFIQIEMSDQTTKKLFFSCYTRLEYFGFKKLIGLTF